MKGYSHNREGDGYTLVKITLLFTNVVKTTHKLQGQYTRPPLEESYKIWEQIFWYDVLTTPRLSCL